MRSEDSIAVLSGVEVRYGRFTALHGLTLTLPKGVTRIVGPNGSGKSTLLKVLAGLLKPNRGLVRVLGLDPYHDFKRTTKLVTYIGEKDPIPGHMRVSSYIELLRNIYSTSRVDEAVELLDLKKHLDRKVYELSQGLRRRLALVEALASNKPLLILDEPFKALDREGRMLAANALKEVIRRGASIVLASHTGGVGADDYIVVLVDGHIVYSGRGAVERITFRLNCKGVERSVSGLVGLEDAVRNGCKIVEAECTF